MAALATVSTQDAVPSPDFEVVSKEVKDYFLHTLSANNNLLFTTDAEDLYNVYLSSLPEEWRQHFTCNTCKRFINTYGTLVTITESGKQVSAIWPFTDNDLFAPVTAALRKAVSSARVTGVFLSDQKTWGVATNTDPKRNIEWDHFFVVPPMNILSRHPLKTPSQLMAEKVEDFGILSRSLYEFPADIATKALGLLQQDSLFRSEKVIGPATFFAKLHQDCADVKNAKTKNNIIWRAVASAPPGFCHIRSSMIGTLLEDLVAGLDFATVSRRFSAKMDPTQYQRSQVLPTTGNVEQAEKIIAKLGLESSLRRRFARLHEVKKIWIPAESTTKQSTGGVFSKVKTKDSLPSSDSLPVNVPETNITWAKFVSKVLPDVTSMSYRLDHHRSYSLAGLVTAVDPEAQPILQWDVADSERQRNPFSWYVYANGSNPNHWSLHPGYVQITAVVPKPSSWSGKFSHQGDGVILVLKGAYDTKINNLALFPETLRSELREIRSVIEAYSKDNKIEGADEGDANGIMINSGNSRTAHKVKVVSKSGITTLYNIDRWD